MIGTVTGLIADLMDGMQLDMDLVVDFPDLVFCDDCMAGIRRIASDLVVDENSLALEVMKAVGPGGMFLSQDHTFENFRRELWTPKLLERRNWDLWETDGSQDIFKVAEKKVLEMLAEKPAALLSTAAENQIDEVVRMAQNKSIDP
jgi:trimethylamine--corrinoid protein Co-methyltransferase